MSSKDDVANKLKIQIAALNDKWDDVSPLFDEKPELMTVPINTKDETALMIAVGTNRSHNFVKQLVHRIKDTDGAAEKLFCKSSSGNSPLHQAAKIGNTKDAMILVKENKDMTRELDVNHHTPLILAARHRNKSTLQYLLKVTPAETISMEEGISSLYAGMPGGDLITLTIQAGFLDVALEIIDTHPDIVLEDSGNSRNALQVLGTKPDFFPSGVKLGYMSRLVYSYIHMNKRSKEVVQLDTLINKRSGKVVQVDICPKVIDKITSGFWSVLQCLSPSINNIHDMKVKHSQSKLLTELICERVTEVDDSNKVLKILGSAAFAAVQHGIPEVVKECIVKYPDICWYKRDNPDNPGESYLSLEAITQRQEQVYNVIWQLFDHKVFQATLIDENMENSLHKAGMLAPPHRLNVVNGAALQMQRELQWYKEVENFIDPLFQHARNINKTTPQKLFSDEHKDLLNEAGQWMKDVSASCTVVAALIITMAFAGAFTLPGGNEADGKPLFLNKRTFMLFIITDAIALFSSTASVVMFLGILTARFSEEDFLSKLPKRMTIGLVSLFVSLAATMIAFSATLAIVLEHI